MSEIARQPRVYWITGLSGAGKTTIGRLWYGKLRSMGETVIFLDGDELRQVFGGRAGYTSEDRRKLPMNYARLCASLSRQGMSVVCCTISMFDSVRAWNRDNIPGYVEVYIKASMETLRRRDQKGLYSTGAQNVAGVGFQVELPKTPDLILENDGQNTPEEQVEILCRACYNHSAAHRPGPDDAQEAVYPDAAAKRGKTVFMSVGTDVIHGGHIEIIRKAAELGELTVGVLTDEVVAAYKRHPLLTCEERVRIISGLKGVAHVIEQDEIGYAKPLRTLRPDYVVHGDDWREGFQKPVREECLALLAEYGGRLVEFPYAHNTEYDRLEAAARSQLSIPDLRRGRLKWLIEKKGLVTCLEAHNGLTGLIAEKTAVMENGSIRQFDGMWVSSLCDSTTKGKPDIELVDFSSRMNTVNEIMEVTTKPMILDGDTGGLTEHFVYTVRTLERIGVSAVIIEDKTGLKRNSLFGVEADQQQDSIANFCHKIRAGKRALKTREFMIIARIESLILEQGMTDALERAFAYTEAGASGIMIHSRRKEPDEIFEFCRRFREKNRHTVLVVVPTSFNTVTEDEWKQRGVNVVIYANHLIRSGYPAMRQTAETILRCRRAKEADERFCMPIKDILTLIPEE